MCYHSLWQERIFCDKYNVYFSILFKWCSTRQCIYARSCMYTAISRKVVGKSARDNHERYCGWFWVRCSSKKFERMAQEAVDVCLRVLKESNKRSFDSYLTVSGTVYWSYPILPFGIVACTFLPTTFLEIAVYVLSRVLSDGLRINELFRASCCTEIKTRANKEEGGGGKEGDTLRPW